MSIPQWTDLPAPLAPAPDESELPAWARPGGLGIAGARTWSTRRLVAISAGALLLGLAVGYGQRGSPAPDTVAGSAPVASPTEPPATTAVGPAAGADTTIPAASTDTTAPDGGSTATAPGEAPAASGGDPGAEVEVLLEVKPTSGPADTAGFRVGPGGWQLGWAFDCSRAGGSGPLEIEVVNPDGSPAGEEAVSQEGAAGKSVNAYTTSGERVLSVTTNCLWALKVTGVRG